MLPSSHIATGVILFTISQMLGISPVLSLPLVIGAVLPDLDFPFYKDNHRGRITHAPLIWFLALTPLGIIWPQFLFLEIGILTHLTLDTIDWGVMWLHPHRTNLYGGLLRKKNIKSRFLYSYLSHNGMVFLELVFLISALLSSYFVLL